MGVQINGDTGNVIATKGTYSGNVTIGGTLTYEDVTNIDSVGLITARQGIEVGASPGVGASISVDGNAIFSGITTATTLRAPTGIVTSLIANTARATTGIVTTLTATTGIVTSFVTNTAKVGAAVTISESGIEASGIGITVANINGAQVGGRRNIIINGAMKVAQRGVSFTDQTEYTLDRFKSERSTDGAATITQSTTAPDGFKNSLKYDITTADTSLAASQYAQITYRVEGQDLQLLAYGTSSAKTITLSFYVRSNKTGNYNLAFEQPDNGDNISSHQYTINSANTWERKVITTAGDTSGVINDDTGAGLAIKWGLAYGSTYSSGSVTNGWAAQNNANFGAGQDVNLFDSTSNEFYITGVQLEVGSQASDFEHRTFGDELLLCQRYFRAVIGGTYTCFPILGRKSGSSTIIADIIIFPPMRVVGQDQDGTLLSFGSFRRLSDNAAANLTGTNTVKILNTSGSGYSYGTTVRFTIPSDSGSTNQIFAHINTGNRLHFQLQAEL